MTLARGAIFLAGVEDVGQGQAGLVSWAGTDREERLGVNPCQEAAAERKALVYALHARSGTSLISFDSRIY